MRIMNGSPPKRSEKLRSGGRSVRNALGVSATEGGIGLKAEGGGGGSSGHRSLALSLPVGR